MKKITYFKRGLSLALCFLLAFSAIPLVSSAAGASFTYDLPSNPTHIIDCVSDDAKVDIIDGVTYIADGTFMATRCPNMTEVAIPASVTSIHSGAFGDLTIAKIYGIPGSMAEIFALTYSIAFESNLPPVSNVISLTATDTMTAAPVTVQLATMTAGATIYYTTDGSTPTTASTLYTPNALVLHFTTTVKAIAVKAGMADSAVSTFNYIIPKLADPTASPAGGATSSAASTVATGTRVTLTQPAPGVDIYYTLDGSVPTATETATNFKYVSATGVILTATSGTTIELKFIAVKGSPIIDSNVVTRFYKIGATLAKPTLTVNGVTYNEGTTIPGTNIPSGTLVTFNIPTGVTGGTIRYTTDGTIPTATTGTVYSTLSPIRIDSSTTLKAILYTTTGTSDVVTFLVGTNNTCAVATASPAGGSTLAAAVGVASGTRIQLSTITNGATIRYTTNGTEPTASSTIYTTSTNIYITGATTLKTKVFKAGLTDSATNTYYYKVGTQLSSVYSSPVSGSYVPQYSYIQLLHEYSSLSGLNIRYTTDGTTPTRTYGNIYNKTSGIYISNAYSTTIRAIAYMDGYTDSNVSEFIFYTGSSSISATPAAGSYSSPINVTLTTSVFGSTIRYTLDGSDPTATNGIIYTSPINISQSCVLKVISLTSGNVSSIVSSFVYTIANKVALPYANPVSGNLTSATNIQLYCPTTSTTIRYTTDGSTPTTTTGTIYNSSIYISTNTTIRAIAYRNDMIVSDVAVFEYTVGTKCATPTASPAPGTYTSTQTVTLSTSTSSAVIRYTTDGTTPTANSTQYTGPITVSKTTTIKAIAVRTGYNNSDVATFTYTINDKIASVTANPSNGTVSVNTRITLSCATAGVTILYTTDNSDPKTNGRVYNSQIVITQTTTIKAIAIKAGVEDGPVSSFTYTVSAVITGEQPSEWARGEVAQALGIGLVPVSLQKNYKNAITRAQFCALGVTLYEKVKGREITERATFTDSTDINVQKLAGLKIISGVGNNKFSPNTTITREQAAAILTSLTQSLTGTAKWKQPDYADNAKISTWARESVGNCRELGIMGSVGNNMFNPKGNYTIEQSICTILRLYKLIMK